MQYEEFKMVFVDIDYLRTLYEADHEVMFREDYAYKKPFLGILITNKSQKYVIPLTSAKLKHKSFSDSNKGYYRVYEIVDIRNISYDQGILVNVTDNSYFKENNISKEESVYYGVQPADFSGSYTHELFAHVNAIGITVGHKGSLYLYTRPSRVLTDHDFAIASMKAKGYYYSKGLPERVMAILSEEYDFVFKVL